MMPRRIASSVLGLFCLLAGVPEVTFPGVTFPGVTFPWAAVVGITSWTVEGAGVSRARAGELSSGVFSDQSDQEAGDPLEPSDAPAVTPFAGIRAPDARVANANVTPADPVVANVEGHPIYLSDLGDAMQSLPEAMRKMPLEVIYPTLLDRMIDHEALVLMARARKLDDDPKIKRAIDAATARILEAALLEHTAVPEVTEAAIKARYTRDFANHPAVEEVHARHILVGTEDEAKWVISELHKGTDFAMLARRLSKDPDSTRGGDLGFFRRDQVWAGFGDLAFALKPGAIGQTPIFNEFGWHVVQVLERRTVPPPSLAQAHDAIRKELLAEAVRRVVAQAREGLEVHKFNMNGAAMQDPTGPGPVGAPSPNDDQTPGTSDLPAGAGPALVVTPGSQDPGVSQDPGASRNPGAPQKPGN